MIKDLSWSPDPTVDKVCRWGDGHEACDSMERHKKSVGVK